jgi:3-methyladenine DNA glycosylase AlkD
MKLFTFNSEIEEQIKQIRQSLHVRMNGEVSDNMTQKGFEYKLNYGALLPEIKQLSNRYIPNKILADRLWHLRIRETMIMATYLYPVDEFSSETADEWVDMLPTLEIAEICCMNLFSKLPYAENKISKWFDDKKELTQVSAWILLARICKNIKKKNLDIYLPKAIESIIYTEKKQLQRAITLALKNMGRIDETTCDKLLKFIAPLQHSDSTTTIYTEIKQDLNFYFNL